MRAAKFSPPHLPRAQHGHRGSPVAPGAPAGDGASVVVATAGRPERLAPLCAAVLADPGTSELVVVVDGPHPAAEATLRALAAGEPRLRWLVVPRRGQNRALHEGVAVARHEVVVLLDDDVIPAAETIAGHLAHHRRGGAKVVVGPMPVDPQAADGSPGSRLYADEYLRHLARIEAGEVKVLDAFWTGNVSMRAADALAVGLYRPDFGAHYHADKDLGYRLAAAGLEGVFDPALSATHHHRRTSAEFLTDAERQGEGRVALHRAHPERLGPLAPGDVVADLPRVLALALEAAGRSRWARPLAHALVALGQVAGRIRGRPVLLPARLARRVMLVRGAWRAGGRP